MTMSRARGRIGLASLVAVTGLGMGVASAQAPAPAAPHNVSHVRFLTNLRDPVNVQHVQMLRARVPQSFDVDELVAGTVSVPAARPGSRLERVAKLTTHPLWGWPVLAAVLYAMYLFVGVLGAGKLVGLVETDVFGAHVNPWLTGLVDRTVPSGLVRGFLVGQYGLWTMGITYAFALILPIVTTFFLAFSVLEDSGYLPRLSVVSNLLFSAVGLNCRRLCSGGQSRGSHSERNRKRDG